jgi:hypothetical protein
MNIDRKIKVMHFLAPAKYTRWASRELKMSTIFRYRCYLQEITLLSAMLASHSLRNCVGSQPEKFVKGGITQYLLFIIIISMKSVVLSRGQQNDLELMRGIIACGGG